MPDNESRPKPNQAKAGGNLVIRYTTIRYPSIFFVKDNEFDE